MQKEGYGCTLRLCIGCNERHDSKLGQSIDPKERHVYTDWLFSVHKIISKFGYDPKEMHDNTLVKRLDPKESWLLLGSNVVGLMRAMCGTRDTCLSLSTREYSQDML